MTDLLTISNDYTINKFEVYNLFAQLVTAKEANAKETSIACDALASGNYIVKIHAENRTRLARIVK